MPTPTIKFKAAQAATQARKAREHIDICKDIVRFLRDDCTARQNQSALLMYLEKKITDTLMPLDTVIRNAEFINEVDINEPEDLPF